MRFITAWIRSNFWEYWRVEPRSGLIVRTSADWRQSSPLTLTPALSRAELVARAAAKICADLGANAGVLAALERVAA